MLLDAAPLFYLDLNDDALIRDIVSGVYTGAPEANDIQNLWPFGAVVSLLYRILPDVPWFGGILFGLQALCVLLILLRSLAVAGRGRTSGAGGRGGRAGLTAGVIAVWVLLQLLAAPHFFFVQYSVTVGFLAAAAAFLFVTGERKRHFGTGVALIGIAYAIRSEMLLLLLPLVLVALLFRYVREVRLSRAENEEMPGVRDFLRYPFITDHYRRYGVTFAVVLLVLAAGWSMDRIGYASSDWHAFVRFFDARTQVYDYTGIPPYEGNETFYDAIGLDDAAVTLLENYNFGLDERIDATAMEAVADYAAGQRAPLGTRVKSAVGAYFYRLHHLGFPLDVTWPQTDAPWNLIAGILYLALILLSWLRAPKDAGIGTKLFRALWQPVLLFACRSALWLYIVVGARDPVRITHPLYFAEIAILAGTFLMQTIGARKEVVQEVGKKRLSEAPDEMADARRRMVLAIRCAAFLAMIAAGVVYAARTLPLIPKEQTRRETENASYAALAQYCAARTENLYFFDVYSSVRETKPLFREVKKTGQPDNLDLLGGWAVKSPAWREKLDRYGFGDAEEAILADGVFFVADAASDVSWLTDYFQSRGMTVAVTAEDAVTGASGDFVVYAVRESAP